MNTTASNSASRPHSDLTRHRPVSVSRILKEIEDKSENQSENLGDAAAEAGGSLGLLKEMFDEGRCTFGRHKMFPSLAVSVAFHLVGLHLMY